MTQSPQPSFDLERWKSEFARNLPGWKSRMQAAGVNSAYAAVAASALLPAAAAFHTGEPYNVIFALGGLLGGVGGNLLANLLQNWKDEAAAAVDIERDLDDPALRAELDALLEKLQALPQAAVALSEADKAWFLAALKEELERLGSSIQTASVMQQIAFYQQGQTVNGSQTNIQNANAPVLSGQFNGPVYVSTSPPPPGADPQTLRQCYLNWVFEQVGRLSLAGIDPKVASEAETQINLGAVYTALLTQSAQNEPDPGRMLRQQALERATECISALAQLDQHSRLVLLGDPGSGKSTFVNFVALCLAGEVMGRTDANLLLLCAPLPPAPDENNDKKKEPQPQPWRHGALLPLRVVLRDFAARGLPAAGQPANANHLLEFIKVELQTAALGEYSDHLIKELRQTGGLLLLDGLDEVPEAENRRTQIKQVTEAFAAAFPKLHLLVTSRTYAYQKQDWRLNGFHEAVLAPFSKGQVNQFVERWYAHIASLRKQNAADFQGRAELLKRAIWASDRLQGLAERPLLLTLMASLHAWRGGSLPERREELYADTVDLLLDLWERPKVVRGEDGKIVVSQPSLTEYLNMDDRQKLRRLLEELAYRAHVAQPDLQGTADISENDLVGGLTRLSNNPDLRPARLVEFLSQRAGLLLPRGVGVYTFPHRTFQEYLAACYLTDHDFPEKVAELTCQDVNRWREVALLAGAKAARGTTSAVWTLVDALCYEKLEPQATAQQLWGAQLAGQALVESGSLNNLSERNQPKLVRVQRGLVQVLRSSLPAVERAAAGCSLAKLGDPRREVLACVEMEFCSVPSGPFRIGSQMISDNEKPLHTLDLPAYWISRYPVTQAQFAEFVTAGGYVEAHYWGEAQKVGYWSKQGFKGRWDNEPRQTPERYENPFELPNHPVVGVSWYEALACCRWLAEQFNLPLCLPSEAEWEKAARGGLQIPTWWEIRHLDAGLDNIQPGLLKRNDLPERQYPWPSSQEAEPDKANYDDTQIGAASAVGCFPGGTSPYGVCDLSGNVWEWTRSLYQDYAYSADDGREDLAGEGTRVLRGGSFNHDKRYARCAYRLRYNPGLRGNNVGFRVALPLSP